MAQNDPWGTTNDQDTATLDAMIARLEMRAAFPPFIEMLDQYLGAMGIDRAASVLDMGCGTGFAARRIAARPGFSGRITGVDLSDYFVAAAARIASEEGVGGKIDFMAGDTHDLALADGAFDAVVAHTLFSHLDDPVRVLAEAARLVRPGGLLAVYDGDYASMTFELEDSAHASRTEQIFIASVVAQPRVLRRMPRLARDAGLEVVEVMPWIIAEAGEGDFWLSGVGAFRKLGPRSGLVTEAEANAWVDELEQASREGVFFGASNYYAYILKRPG